MIRYASSSPIPGIAYKSSDVAELIPIGIPRDILFRHDILPTVVLSWLSMILSPNTMF